MFVDGLCGCHLGLEVTRTPIRKGAASVVTLKLSSTYPVSPFAPFFRKCQVLLLIKCFSKKLPRWLINCIPT